MLLNNNKKLYLIEKLKWHDWLYLNEVYVSLKKLKLVKNFNETKIWYLFTQDSKLVDSSRSINIPGN